MSRRRDARRTYEQPVRTERASECSREDEDDRILPRLVCATSQRRALDESLHKNPQWMAAKPKTTRAAPAPLCKKQIKAKRPPSLSLLDAQMLVLCRSAIQHSWGPSSEPTLHDPFPAEVYGYESNYAATQVQRLVRGVATRKRLAAFNGPRFERAAGQIQCVLRRFLVARRVAKRRMEKRHDCATRIQAWVRGCHSRDRAWYARARVLIARITLFQRRFRGYRFWNLVAALLAQRRHNAATLIQRFGRGMASRRRVERLRHERVRFSVELQRMGHLHRQQARCQGCHAASWTEDSLLVCFMVRFIGLHDFSGAKVLGFEGLQAFPLSGRFSFMYAILLQAMGDDLELSMAFLRRSEGIREEEILEMERRYLFPALQRSNNDVAVLLDLAIVSQCTDRLTRAASLYRLALEQPPIDYAVPGYLHRVDMLDRLLLNYHRFCSVFNDRQINVLAKTVPMTKRGEHVRVLVTRHGHFTRIQCTDEQATQAPARYNAVYLTDDEVARVLANKETLDGDDVLLPPSVANAVNRKNNTRIGSTRRSARMLREEKIAAAQDEATAARKQIVTLVFQSKFRGLHVKPFQLAALSVSRSKLQLTRDHAERLLRELLFVDPQAEEATAQRDLHGGQASTSAVSLHRILLMPSVIKQRMLRMDVVLKSHAVVDIQRVVRGFRVRARMRRVALLHTIRQHQVDQLYARLHHNAQFRERRRCAAVAIQCVCKGFATRRLITKWRQAATTIQRVHRGHRGRKRAVAFREGNLTFYMAERVYQRGVSISGKAVVLVIDRCGLSFRLEAYDMADCTMYPGFLSHASTMALIRYENWSYAQRLVGRDVWLHGTHAVLSAVASINQADAQCVVTCDVEGSAPSPRLVDLSDCIYAINLRSLGLQGLAAEQLLLPLTSDDTSRIVACIVDRLALVPAIPMVTKELQRKTPGSFVLTLLPPPQVHYVFTKNESITIETMSHASPNTRALLSVSLVRQIAFPVVVDGYRGATIGKRVFRQQCRRHATHFTKCRCVLLLTTTPAYVHTLTLALTPPPPPRPLPSSSD